MLMFFSPISMARFLSASVLGEARETTTRRRRRVGIGDASLPPPLGIHRPPGRRRVRGSGDVSTSAVATDTTLEARIDAAAADVLQDVAPAGLSIAVARRGRPSSRRYGYADLADRIPATATTIYRLASITKEFTAAAILHLAEQGRLTLDDPVVEHLPDRPGLDPRITLRHLLSHTSGIADARVFSALESRWRRDRPPRADRPGRLAAARLRTGNAALV